MGAYSAFTRIVLGTVQLGMPYGIANTTGQPDQQSADGIVAAAWERDLHLFDTAQGYGTSEEVLGTALRRCARPDLAKIISKLPSDLHVDAAPQLERMVGESLTRLGITRLYGLMFHRQEHLPLLNGPVGDAVQQMLEKGMLQGFGVSVYTPDAAREALEHPLVTLVQVPASLFDRRFEAAGVFSSAERLGKEVHVRSVLLQGALCMKPDTLPDHLADLRPALTRFDEWCTHYALEPGPLALAWALRRYPLARILFGAESAEQVRKNLDFQERSDSIAPALWGELDRLLPPQTAQLLNPSLWNVA